MLRKKKWTIGPRQSRNQRSGKQGIPQNHVPKRALRPIIQVHVLSSKCGLRRDNVRGRVWAKSGSVSLRVRPWWMRQVAKLFCKEMHYVILQLASTPPIRAPNATTRPRPTVVGCFRSARHHQSRNMGRRSLVMFASYAIDYWLSALPVLARTHGTGCNHPLSLRSSPIQSSPLELTHPFLVGKR